MLKIRGGVLVNIGEVDWLKFWGKYCPWVQSNRRSNVVNIFIPMRENGSSVLFPHEGGWF